MKEHTIETEQPAEWFAIRTRQEFRAEEELSPLCEELYFPKEAKSTNGKRKRLSAVIPRVLFVKTTPANLLEQESLGRQHPEQHVPFWIYRYPKDNRIQPISPASINLLRLLTAADTTRCEIYRKEDFKAGQRVRVTAGEFKGYEGYVQRVRKNKHVVVKIEGICLVMLPFIHPDLLQEV